MTPGETYGGTMPKRKLAEMAAERYSDEAVRDAVIEHAQKLRTAERIESGELVLPTEHDAETWYRREQGERQEASEIDQLKARLAALEGGAAQKQPMADKLRASGKSNAGRQVSTSKSDEEQ